MFCETQNFGPAGAVLRYLTVARSDPLTVLTPALRSTLGAPTLRWTGTARLHRLLRVRVTADVDIRVIVRVTPVSSVLRKRLAVSGTVLRAQPDVLIDVRVRDNLRQGDIHNVRRADIRAHHGGAGSCQSVEDHDGLTDVHLRCEYAEVIHLDGWLRRVIHAEAVFIC